MKKLYCVTGFIKIHNNYKRLYYACYSPEDAIATFNIKMLLFEKLFDKGMIKDYEIAI